MYGYLTQHIVCVGCHMKSCYPRCTACDKKAFVDGMDTLTRYNTYKYYFGTSVLYQMALARRLKQSKELCQSKQAQRLTKQCKERA